MLSHEAKIVFFGARGVGKSSIINRFSRGSFSPPYEEVSIGAAFVSEDVPLENDRIIRLKLWDEPSGMSGRFYSSHGNIKPHYIRGSKAVVIVYYITDRYSFENVRKEIEYLKKLCEEHKDWELPVVAVVGNKIDLEKDQREVGQEEVEKLLEKMKTVREKEKLEFIAMETSAKENTNVSELFMKIASMIDEKTTREFDKQNDDQDDVVFRLVKISKKKENDQKCTIL